MNNFVTPCPKLAVRELANVIDEAELARHNRAGDAWVAVDGVVYDVSTFEKRHPGGRILLKNTGFDISTDFYALHKPSTVQVLKKLPKIGILKPPPLTETEST